VAIAAHHLHLDTLPTLPSYSGRACAIGHHWIGLSFSRAKSRSRRPDGMVWYGMVLKSRSPPCQKHELS